MLLDSITRLGRAYNNASPASGRILSGGVDSTALYPPKRFLGAARNIEDGGSLTIVATAMVETGSTGDTVIFEEFKGTGNAELKLDRKISERRVFPAVDVNPSGTRKDELLLSTDEFAVVHKLRRVLSGLDPHQAIDLLMSQLRKTKNNYEFLVQVSKTAPGSADDRLVPRRVGRLRVGPQPGHDIAAHMRCDRIGITGIKGVARHCGQRKQYARNPFRCLGDVGVGVDLAAVACGDQIPRPEVGQVGHQCLYARAGAGCELLRLIDPQLHQQRTGIVVGRAGTTDADSHLAVQALDLLEHRMRLGPVRVVETHDRGPQQGHLVGEMAIEPAP